jgi:hypothetical protein
MVEEWGYAKWCIFGDMRNGEGRACLCVYWVDAILIVTGGTAHHVQDIGVGVERVIEKSGLPPHVTFPCRTRERSDSKADKRPQTEPGGAQRHRSLASVRPPKHK